MRRMIITSSLLLALSATAMASQVYKWVDAQGVTHFSSQPPQGQQATSINTAAPPPAKPVEAAEPDATPTFESISDPEQAAIDKKVKQEVAAKEAERKKYCEDVRTNLAQLQNNPRLRMDVNGEMRRLGEDERQAKIAESEKAIKENCN